MDSFSQYIDDVRYKILGVAEAIDKEKAVPYGYQFTLLENKEKVVLTIYNGKKGRKYVWAGSNGCLRNRLEHAVCGTDLKQTAGEKKYKVWAGSDESGKGDFFGSLVVAAVVLDDGAAKKLEDAGVKDCKALTDKKITELEEVIMDSALAYSVLELKPAVYNYRYQQVKNTGGNLNKLLGLGHIAALSEAISKRTDCEGALIDQFTPSDEVVNALKNKFPGIEFRQQPRAESNMAVAAASVLARAKFLRTMEALSNQAEMELPKGGSALATDAARLLAEKFGKDALNDYVKLHFANYQKI